MECPRRRGPGAVHAVHTRDIVLGVEPFRRFQGLDAYKCSGRTLRSNVKSSGLRGIRTFPGFGGRCSVASARVCVFGGRSRSVGGGRGYRPLHHSYHPGPGPTGPASFLESTRPRQAAGSIRTGARGPPGECRGRFGPALSPANSPGTSRSYGSEGHGDPPAKRAVLFRLGCGGGRGRGCEHGGGCVWGGG
jgi:hypothetical protein